MQATAVDRIGILTKAMAAPESFAIRMVYVDGKGNRTRRVVSPTQLDQGTGKFVALCLCRQEPRSFKLDNVEAMEIIPASEVFAPVEIEDLQ